MNKLAGIFKKLTAYDHFLVFLIILSVMKIIDVFVDSGGEAGLHYLKLGAGLFAVSTALFFIFKYTFDKKKKYQHALISTFLILLMMSHDDPNPIRGVLVILLVYIAKFFIKYKKHSIFNPVVFAIGVVTIISMITPAIKAPPLDWSGVDLRFTLFGTALPLTMIPILLSLIFNGRRIGKHPLAISFIITSLLAGFVLNAYSVDYFSYIVVTFFVGTAIVVEPKTAPHKNLEQILYGVAVAAIILGMSALKVPNAIVIGIMTGNILYFINKQVSKQG